MVLKSSVRMDSLPIVLSESLGSLVFFSLIGIDRTRESVEFSLQELSLEGWLVSQFILPRTHALTHTYVQILILG